MSVHHIEPRQAFERMQHEGCVYLDVRTEKEFANGHPKGAINIPVFFATPEGRVLNPDFVSEVKKRFPLETPIVLGCQSGGRSTTATKMLLEAGYKNVCNMMGGFGGGSNPMTGEECCGWFESNLPCE